MDEDITTVSGAIAAFLSAIEEWENGIAEIETLRDRALEVRDREAAERLNAILRNFRGEISEARDDWILNRLPILHEGDVDDSELAGLDEITGRLDILRFGSEAASKLRSHLNESREPDKITEPEDHARLIGRALQMASLSAPKRSQPDAAGPKAQIAITKYREAREEAREILHRTLQIAVDSWGEEEHGYWRPNPELPIDELRSAMFAAELLSLASVEHGLMYLAPETRNELLSALEPGNCVLTMLSIPSDRGADRGEFAPDEVSMRQEVVKAILVLELGFSERGDRGYTDERWEFDELVEHVEYVGPVDLVGGVNQSVASGVVSMLSFAGADSAISDVAAADSPYLPFYRDLEVRRAQQLRRKLEEEEAFKEELKALEELREKALKEKERERTDEDRPRRQGIPEHVRHEVWRRDQGKCVDCGSRERLEFDHIIPFSMGGSNTARNIELRCETCNRRKAATI